MVKENPTLVKNMKHVKWNAIPPLKGPDPKGLIKDKKQDKPIQEKKYGRYSKIFTKCYFNSCVKSS